MKIATWNVNGIRARQSQVQDWLEREQPDVVCLQEIKASIDQLPVWLCEMEGYWCYWHGGKGYSGVGLHVSKRIAPDRRASNTRIRLRTSDRARAASAGDRGVGLCA
jgi:exodeoxyribonuclease-3